MHRRLLYAIIIYTLLIGSCEPNSSSIRINKHQIGLLPLGDIDSSIVRSVKTVLEQSANVKITVLPLQPLPSNCYIASRNRFSASLLLNFLDEERPSSVSKMIGITNRDIEIINKSGNGWGIMGLGKCPGVSCIVSTFRPVRTAKSRIHLEKRMVVLSLHELGHTYSLPHCNERNCIMVDAEGKMKLDSSDRFCERCLKLLNEENIEINEHWQRGYSQHTENK